MFTIEEATEGDFERVLPCLRRFEDIGKGNPDSVWRGLFQKHWNNGGRPCGLILVSDGDVKGYIATLFSDRMIDGKKVVFCNLNTWIVDSDCRGQSLQLLLKALGSGDCVYTSFSADPKTTAIVLNKLGFVKFDVRQRIIAPLPSLNRLTRHYEIETDAKRIPSLLNKRDLQIFNDHSKFECDHIVVSGKESYVYLIATKIRRKNLPFAEIHYVSDPHLFTSSVRKVSVEICFRLGVFGVLIDERYLDGNRIPFSRVYLPGRSVFYKEGAVRLKPGQVDTLYSELPVLNW